MKTPISFDGPKDGHIFMYGLEGLRWCNHRYVGVMFEIIEPLSRCRVGSLLLENDYPDVQGRWHILYSTHLSRLIKHYNIKSILETGYVTNNNDYKYEKTQLYRCSDMGVFTTLGKMCEEENDTGLPIVGSYFVYDKIEDFLIENFELAL